MSRRQFQGTVHRNTGKNMLVVAVELVVIHPIYRKRYRRQKRYHVHAESPHTHAIGSTVLFEECRPMSKTKRWRVVEVNTVNKVN